jgi:hypothetical protein
MFQHLQNQRLRESPFVFQEPRPTKDLASRHFAETLNILGVYISREQGPGTRDIILLRLRL